MVMIWEHKQNFQQIWHLKFEKSGTYEGWFKHQIDGAGILSKGKIELENSFYQDLGNFDF